MILREWRARARPEGADAYEAHFRAEVGSALASVEGFRGGYLARRLFGDEVELVVLTTWESLAAVRDFAGPDPVRAVIQPAARRVLSAYDDEVRHYEIVATVDAP
ncbi:MAG: antibiotic biosynthesis monooxygenase [Chloroflexi bacterium]|nr:antibiotic biosynthesis monooxygenase [Chloroflexota bacterium]